MKMNKQHNKFNIPKDYFENFEEKLLLQLNFNQHDFVVPKHYFHSVNNEILRKLNNQNRKKRIYFYTAISAAMFVLFFSILFNNKANLKSLTDDEIIEYLSLNIEENDLNENISENTININPIKFKDANLIEYLDLQDIDEIQINNF